jgi:hypothetical protein
LPPVRWLFAPDLIAYTKRTLLHAFYGGDLDPRDWMRLEDGHGHVEDGGPEPDASATCGSPRSSRRPRASCGSTTAPTSATAASRCSPPPTSAAPS